MLMTARTITTAVLAIITLALIVGVAFWTATTPPEEETADDPDTICYVDDVGEESGATDEIISELKAAGFTSDPNDGQEVMYSPACGVGTPSQSYGKIEG